MLDSKGETNQWKNLSTAFSGIQLVCRTVFIFLIHYGRGKKIIKILVLIFVVLFFWMANTFSFPGYRCSEEKSIFCLHPFMR